MVGVEERAGDVIVNDDRSLELDDSGATIIDTSSDLDDGQNKCEKCGSTEISINPNSGNLRCHFCRHEQVATKAQKFVTDISQLEGEVIGSGAGDMIADVADQLTFKCSSCAAEVVIDTTQKQQARCHWCRNTLSVNQQIPNGAIPDKVLPFSVKRDAAVAAIEKFVGGRRSFASKTFKAEFTSENVMGVYLPYMVIDVNSHASFDGEARHVVRTYTEVQGNIERTFQDVDTYRIIRDFDLTVEDLTVEASSEKLKHRSSQRTNNIINAIAPFDTDNSVVWDANFMTGFTSQKRDINVSELAGLVQEKANDIASDVVMTQTMTAKSRGVRWINRDMVFKGKQWRSAYLPVWIYSYQQNRSGGRNKIHYVAVNGRNQKTMGSVPLDVARLFIASAIIAIALGGVMFLAFEALGVVLGVLVGIIFFAVINGRYRNANAIHDYVRKTTRNMNNLISNDTRIRQERGVFVSERRLDDPRHSSGHQNQNRRESVSQNQSRHSNVGKVAAAGAAATVAAGAAVATMNSDRSSSSQKTASSNQRKVAEVSSSKADTSRKNVSSAAKTAKAKSEVTKASTTAKERVATSATRGSSSSRTSSVSKPAAKSSASRPASSSSRSTPSRSTSSSSSSRSASRSTSTRSSSSSSSSRSRK